MGVGLRLSHHLLQLEPVNKSQVVAFADKMKCFPIKVIGRKMGVGGWEAALLLEISS